MKKREGSGQTSTTVAKEVRVAISSSRDIMTARDAGRILATDIGFVPIDLTMIVTAISELARNIVQYAGSGEIVVRELRSKDGRGLGIVAKDYGPGIKSLDLALQEGFSTSGGLGLGLPGVKRLMDSFEIQSQLGRGTVVTCEKWLRIR